MRSELTPIQKVDGIYVKRDDLFTVAGVCGGKARSCWHIAKGASGGLVTASSRHSPQAVITAHIANSLGIDCHLHMPFGGNTPEMDIALGKGAKIAQHKPGYNNDF